MHLIDNIDLFGFELDSLPAIEADLEGIAAHARAVKTRSRINARRASSENVLSEILPQVIEQGDAWHVMSSGDVDSLSFLAHLIATADMDYVSLSTWCMALDDVDRLGVWLANGKIKHLDCYVGEIFPGSYGKEYAALIDTVRSHGGRVAVFRNHSKTFLCRSSEKAWVVESSANINTNPRTENTVVTADLALFQHHKAYFDSIRAFNRDFDDWAPQP
jgi:hypothetical protein